MRQATRLKTLTSPIGLRGFGATALALSMIAGCSTQAEAKTDTAAVRQFARRGYISEDQYGVATSFATWVFGAERVDIALTVPARPGLAPLVVYLPSLGEMRTSVQALRTAWANSGYAVLSLQPLAQEARPQGGASRGTSAARIAALGRAMAELAERAQQHEAPFDRVDLSRVALAGLGLGADTAMAAAGADVSALPLPLAAVISLNESAGLAGPLGSAQAAIRIPVLSVAGHGRISKRSDDLRFQRMPSGDKYLLALADAGPSPTAAALEVAAVQSVTTAFFDAYVKRDGGAREWLVKDAPRWLASKAG
jgi:dienelactone hydrolase